MIEYILFALGFVFLVKGASFLVDGASSIARRLGIAPIVIGLTLVAFGTSFPELAVNVLSVSQSDQIPIGNIVGSNITNILLILGLAALVYPISIPKNTVWKEIPFSLIAAIVFAIIANDFILSGLPPILSRGDGLLLLIFFLIFLYYISILIRTRKHDTVTHFIRGSTSLEKQVQIKTYSNYVSFLMVAIGLIGLVVGGKWVVDGAIFIANQFSVSQALISLAIIAVGTSLPELVTSIVAMRKRRSEIAIGNIVGSNIFNIFFVLGISSTIRPMNFPQILNFDILIVVASTLLLFGFMFIGRKHTLDRWQGLAFLLFYAAYILFIFYRG